MQTRRALEGRLERKRMNALIKKPMQFLKGLQAQIITEEQVHETHQENFPYHNLYGDRNHKM